MTGAGGCCALGFFVPVRADGTGGNFQILPWAGIYVRIYFVFLETS